MLKPLIHHLDFLGNSRREIDAEVLRDDEEDDCDISELTSELFGPEFVRLLGTLMPLERQYLFAEFAIFLAQFCETRIRAFGVRLQPAHCLETAFLQCRECDELFHIHEGKGSTMRYTVHNEKMLYKSQQTREKKERIVVHIREFAPLIIVFVMFLTVVGGLVAHVANDPRYATAAAFQPFGK